MKPPARPGLVALCTVTALLMLAVAAFQPPLDPSLVHPLHLPASNALLRHALNPNAALLLLAGGWLLCCVEMCRPGKFLPGTIGILAWTLGAYALICSHPLATVHLFSWTAVLAAAILTWMLLRVAWLARRSKFKLENSPAPPSATPTHRHSSGYSSTAKPTE
jgi:membrane-bound ClpP family serine protease